MKNEMKPPLSLVIPFYFKNPRYIRTFIKEWACYTPHFFKDAPFRTWWDYFGSHWRVANQWTYFAFLKDGKTQEEKDEIALEVIGSYGRNHLKKRREQLHKQGIAMDYGHELNEFTKEFK